MLTLTCSCIHTCMHTPRILTLTHVAHVWIALPLTYTRTHSHPLMLTHSMCTRPTHSTLPTDKLCSLREPCGEGRRGRGHSAGCPAFTQGRRPGLKKFQSLRPAALPLLSPNLQTSMLGTLPTGRPGDMVLPEAFRGPWDTSAARRGQPGGGSDTWSRKPGTGPHVTSACQHMNSHAFSTPQSHIPTEGHSLLTITFHRHSWKLVLLGALKVTTPHHPHSTGPSQSLDGHVQARAY